MGAVKRSAKVRQRAPRTHDLVETLVKDPKRPPKLRVIRGFPGQSTVRGHCRMYLDLELRRFVDVPVREIVHQQAGEDAVALDPTLIWVSETTRIRHHGSWLASEDPTTMATGEEGGDDPTTMATGEESSLPGGPLDELINPFGLY